MALALMGAATKALELAAREIHERTRPRIGATLRPGPDTPLWNELAKAVQWRLRRRGEKARLARVLGLPRQRVNDLFRRRRHLPDAERALLLLVWLQTRAEGRDLS